MLPADEALHHDLTGHRADGRAREAGAEQREREERARGAAEDRLERLVRALERVDVASARCSKKTAAAITSIAMLISPAIAIAMTTSIRV